MYQEYPFDKPCTEPLQRLAWWESVKDDTASRVLAVR